MSNYVFAYHGGEKPENPEEGAKHMAKWKAWIGGLGDAVVNSPLKKASLTGFHATAKHIAAKAVSPSSETMRTI